MISAVRRFMPGFALLLLLAPGSALAAGSQPAPAIRIAQAGNISEEKAFEAAKELGTVEAWEAFLKNFPRGFRADLARAYVRKLKSEGEKASGPAPAQPAETPAETQAETPSAPVLEMVDLGPGEGSWTRGAYAVDGGDGKAPAAIVQANGVKLTAYCTNRRTVPVMLSAEPQGEYPEFDERVRQGLADAGAQSGESGFAEIAMQFAGGQLYKVRALVHGPTGALMLGDAPDGFAAYSPVLETLMAGDTVTVSAPPFGATFQLRGSRAAICGMLRQCDLASAQPSCS